MAAVRYVNLEKETEAYLDIIARKICHHESLGEAAGSVLFSPVPCDGAREVNGLVGSCRWTCACADTHPRFTDYS